MKKLMWILAFIPTAITLFYYNQLPDIIPAHFDFNGNVDRWGNKIESLLLPLIILLLTIVMHFTINSIEKKALKASSEKELMEMNSVIKVMKFIAILENIIFGILNCLLLICFMRKEINTASIMKYSLMLIGIMLIILGNYTSRVIRNTLVGFRMSYSLYNDITWLKSNRFASKVMVIDGILIFISTFIFEAKYLIILSIINILISILIIMLKAKKIYEEEIKKDA